MPEYSLLHCAHSHRGHGAILPKWALIELSSGWLGRQIHLKIFKAKVGRVLIRGAFVVALLKAPRSLSVTSIREASLSSSYHRCL